VQPDTSRPAQRATAVKPCSRFLGSMAAPPPEPPAST
jgi:hypothetical protein